MRPAPGTLGELVAWLDVAPAGTLVPAAEVRNCLAAAAASARTDGALTSAAAPAPAATWRERLWTVPADTRLGVAELCEALGRSKSWVYGHTSAKSGRARLPFRKLDGELVFVAGELRAWVREQEETVVPGRSEPRVVPLGRADARRRGGQR